MKNILFCLGLLLSVVLPASLFAKEAAACEPATNSFSTNCFIHAQLPAKHFALEANLIDVEDDEITASCKKELFDAEATTSNLTTPHNYAVCAKQTFAVPKAANPALPIFIFIQVFRL